MSVTVATAQKWIERWQLDGRAATLTCGCRIWIHDAIPAGMRLVYTCGSHRHGA